MGAYERIPFDGRTLGRWYDFCCWHIAAPDVYDGTPQLAKADTAFQGAGRLKLIALSVSISMVTTAIGLAIWWFATHHRFT